jgi:hypothetical protein
MEHLEVVWSGSDRDVYLCVPDPAPATLRVTPMSIPPASPYASRKVLKGQVLALLGERDWTRQELRVVLQADRLVLSGVIHRLRQAGLIKCIGFGRYAKVAR